MPVNDIITRQISDAMAAEWAKGEAKMTPSIELIQINDTFVVKFPKREFVLTRRDDATTIAQYYADQHGLPVIEDGKTIYSPPTRDGYCVMSQAEIERNAAQAQ